MTREDWSGSGLTAPAAGGKSVQSIDEGMLGWAVWLGEQAHADNLGGLEDWLFSIARFRAMLFEGITVLRPTCNDLARRAALQPRI